MKETIYRQDAIDAINHICPVDTEYDCTLLDRVDVRYVLSDLPSAQPEITDEQAIDHLQKSGWMKNHDRQMYEMGLKERLADDSGSYDALLPSAQPTIKPRKGKWIEHNPHKFGLGIVFECSECGKEIECEEYNFCPNCGADMIGGSNGKNT